MSRIALVQGDPAGIGPELLVKFLASEAAKEARASFIIIGDPAVLRAAQARLSCELNQVRFVDTTEQCDFAAGEIYHLNIDAPGIGDSQPGTLSAACGRACLTWLEKSYELARDRKIDGICFLPFNKQAMHLAGSAFTDELSFARSYFNLSMRPSEFNVADGMWNGRVTSHVPMKEVSGLLTVERILESIELTDRTLKLAGFAQPRIVVAAYNPHAGDGGLLGDEEIRVIRPAVEVAREKQISAVGPLPADTLWLKVRDGAYDAVVTMYHDQGQIAIKLMGFDRGVSVLAGLPIPITTPAHGTAFDIAGKGVANSVPTVNAIKMVVEMAMRNSEGA